MYKNRLFIEVLIKKITFAAYAFTGLASELQDESNLAVTASKAFISSLNYDQIDGFNKSDTIIYIQLKQYECGFKKKQLFLYVLRNN